MSPEDLARRLKNAYIPVQIQSIQHCESYSCFIINDLVLLSYSEAQFLYQRNKHCSRLTKVFRHKFLRTIVIALYNMFLWSVNRPEYAIIHKRQVKAKKWKLLRQLRLRRLRKDRSTRSRRLPYLEKAATGSV